MKVNYDKHYGDFCWYGLHVIFVFKEEGEETVLVDMDLQKY